MGDDLQTNPFFLAFQRSPHFAAAAASKYVVICPAAGALSLIKVNDSFLSAHLLVASDFFDREYRSLNGVVCTFEGQRIAVRAGNLTSARTLKVVQEELYYDDDFNSFALFSRNKSYARGTTSTFTSNGIYG